MIRESNAALSVSELVKDQEQFYRTTFGMDYTFEGIEIPVQPEGFNRLIIVAEGMTLQRVYDQCSRLLECRKFTDLNEEVPYNDRDPKNGSYAIWVRDRVEADEEHKNKSTNDLKKASVKGVTLLERLVYELCYFKETSKHLDVDNITLCAGSRFSDGYVPYVSWYDDKLKVDWSIPGHAYVSLRVREVAF